ncbi:MAG: hypothetical protein GQE15_33770 [Archangiaceae bacterium]|nr:hypothetical protein [Archangiaceae bacterium]
MRRLPLVRLLLLLSACAGVVPGVDGGPAAVDGSVELDAGNFVADASVVVDASVPDASVVVDASVPDASVPDASVVVDASVPDASVVVDASVPDASVVLRSRFEVTAAGARLTAGTMVMDVQVGPPLVRQPLSGGTLTLTPLPPVAK